MIVKVHMFAFAKDGDRSVVRNVEIPDDKFNKAKDTNTKLELVFYYGQNDFQAKPTKPMPSVSVGDVAEINGRYFMVMGAGWKELSNDEFLSLKPPTATSAYLLINNKGNI